MPQVITEDDVERSLTPVAKRWNLSDTLAPGLMLRAGAKAPSWYLRVTRGGIFKIVLGHPPSMSLSTARAIARNAMQDHLAGVPIDDAWLKRQHKVHGLREAAERPPVYQEPPGPWTWAQGAEAYAHSLAHRGRSPVTVAGNRKSLLQILDQFADMPIAEITTEDVQAAVDEIALTTPALAEMALKSARPFGEWISTGPRVEKSGVRTNRYRRLTMPPPELRKPRGWKSVSRWEVARLIAMCRAGVLAGPVARALEVIVLTGLPRSAVCSTRHDDIEDGIWTIRPELLKRKDAIRIELTPRLRELLKSDDNVWVFPQPRKAHRSRTRSHLAPVALGRATWELPGVPTATEAFLAMSDYLHGSGGGPDVALLRDSGGNDDALDEDGGPVWRRRSALVEEWCAMLEPLVPEQAAMIDPVAVKAAMRERRPSQD